MLTYAALTSPGSRSVNEDSYHIVEAGGVLGFFVADGLGGHGRGKEASQAVVEMAGGVFRQGPKRILEQCFQGGQDYLMAEQLRLGAVNELKSTMVALVLSGESAQIGHIGDSRIYWFRKGKLLLRTLDHSVPQMLVASGEINEKEIRGHEDRNRLLRVMGVEWNTPKYELHEEAAYQPEDSFLLCSDGFWEYVLEKSMLKTLKAARSPEQWLAAMETILLKNAARQNMDNYTAVAVWIR